jgi:endo-1,4-beta-D-glucanase Y
MVEFNGWKVYVERTTDDVLVFKQQLTQVAEDWLRAEKDKPELS